MKNSIRNSLLTTFALTAVLSAPQAQADCPDKSKPCPVVIHSQGVDVGAAITQGSPGVAIGAGRSNIDLGSGDRSLYRTYRIGVEGAVGSKSLLNASVGGSIGGRMNIEEDLALGVGAGAHGFASAASGQPQTRGAVAGGEVSMISPRSIGDLSTVLTLSLAGGKGSIGSRASTITEGGMRLTVAAPKKFSIEAGALSRNYSATGQQEFVTDVATYYGLSGNKQAFAKLLQREFTEGNIPTVRSLQGGMRITLPNSQASGAN